MSISEELEILIEKVCDLDSDVNQTSGELLKTCSLMILCSCRLVQSPSTEKANRATKLTTRSHDQNQHETLSDFMQDVIRNIQNANSHKFSVQLQFFLPPSLTLRQGQGGMETEPSELAVSSTWRHPGLSEDQIHTEQTNVVRLHQASKPDACISPD